jgi:hypothetical protein
MVEVHRARRKPAPAVRARPIAELIQQPRLGTPLVPLPLKTARDPRAGGRPRRVALLSPNAMAVRTNDVALRDLREDGAGRPEHRSARSQTERLRGRVSVIEVHLVGSERPTAIKARK